MRQVMPAAFCRMRWMREKLLIGESGGRRRSSGNSLTSLVYRGQYRRNAGQTADRILRRTRAQARSPINPHYLVPKPSCQNRLVLGNAPPEGCAARWVSWLARPHGLDHFILSQPRRPACPLGATGWARWTVSKPIAKGWVIFQPFRTGWPARNETTAPPVP